ncbi:hypothetical protein RUND412_011541, partial [Rhizina undulata]
MSTSDPTASSDIYRNKGNMLLLKADRVWSIVNESEETPTQPDLSSRIVVNDYTRKLESFETRLAKAVLTIFLSLKPKAQAYLGNEENPTIMWETLQENLDLATHLAGAAIIYQRFARERYNGQGSIKDYIAHLLEYRSFAAIIPVIASLLPNFKTLNHVNATIINHERLLKGWDPNGKKENNQ